MQEKISYSTAKFETHAILATFLGSGLLLMYALWPEWGKSGTACRVLACLLPMHL